MKIINEINGKEIELPVSGCVCGFRGTKVELDHSDLSALLALDDELLRKVLESKLKPRIMPEDLIKSIKSRTDKQ
ncbi:hypothetical protein NVP1154O_01, partial [Vibrio phage 1.154.O._10N.222.52.B12]